MNEDVAHVFSSDEQKKNSDFNNQNQILCQEKTVKSNRDDFRENEELLALNELIKKPDLPKIKTNKSWMVSVLTEMHLWLLQAKFPDMQLSTEAT